MMTDKELVERYKMALEAIVELQRAYGNISSYQLVVVAKKALEQK